MKNFNIEKIHELTIDEAREMAIEIMQIKEHECIFIDFGGYFGYSVLVFKNDKHIYYADDFELHHNYIVKESGKTALKQWYIEALNRKLFTDAELMEEITSYDEYEKKNYFLRNYYIMRYDYVSIFGIGEEAKKAFDEARKTYTIYNPISFCYVADENIIDIQLEISKHLEASFEKLKASDETFRAMIAYELANHEACITCSYEDALGSLGLSFDGLTESQQKIVLQELNKQIDEYC